MTSMRASTTALFMVLAAMALAVPGLTATLVPWPFVVALFLFGLPHGAADGAVAARVFPRSAWPVLAAAYLATAAATMVAVRVAPAPSLVGFLLLTAWHFGAGDAEIDLPGASRGGQTAWAVGRGALVVGLPFAFYPLGAWAPFQRLLELTGSPAVTFSEVQLVGFGAGVSACAAAGFVVAAGSSERPEAGAWIESAGLALLLASAPPLLSIGTYFLFVHGLRQCAALGSQLRPGDASGTGATRAMVGVHLLALPLLLPTYLLLAGVVLRTGPLAWSDLAALSLGVYAVVTLPHHLLHWAAARRGRETEARSVVV